MPPAMDATTDVDLVRRAQRGDDEAFLALVRRHQAAALRLAGRFLPQREDAEDVVQEAIVAAYRQLPRFRGEATFATWLGRIAVHLALRVNRRRHSAARRGPADSTRYSAEPDAAERLAVREAVAELPERLRVPVVLRFYEGLSGQEIARLIGCRESTVWTRLYNGLRKLREGLTRGELP